MYDYLVFIGRFSPFHLGHQAVVEEALQKANKVIILVGSANSPRTLRNPWTFEERARVILCSFSEENQNRIIILPLNDYTYNDQEWIKNVQRKVSDSILRNLEGNTENVTLHGFKDFKIGLIGRCKDHTSYYLKLFPEWDSVSVESDISISGTFIRDKYFKEGVYVSWFTNSTMLAGPRPEYVPDNIFDFLIDFQKTPDYDKLKKEYDFVETYKKAWDKAPYPPVFVTVDAVVIQSGHILLVKRRAEPGKGMWALPGGFINEYEKLDDAVIRELKEETKVKVPVPVLKGSIKDRKMFDDPYRSARGRTITQAYLFELEPQLELPKVRGSDDAEKAAWIPLADLNPKRMFEDHYHIIHNMVAEL